jgi:hypothetical protein
VVVPAMCQLALLQSTAAKKNEDLACDAMARQQRYCNKDLQTLPASILCLPKTGKNFRTAVPCLRAWPYSDSTACVPSPEAPG